jgi:hypothetical protein
VDAGQELGEEAGPVLHPLRAGFHQDGQLGPAASGQVGRGALEVGPDQPGGVEFVSVGRQLDHGQPLVVLLPCDALTLIEWPRPGAH